MRKFSNWARRILLGCITLGWINCLMATVTDYVPMGPRYAKVPFGPPPEVAEPNIICPNGQTYIHGRYEYSLDRYIWRSGYCDSIPDGYEYVQARYEDGIYHLAHYAPMTKKRARRPYIIVQQS